MRRNSPGTPNRTLWDKWNRTLPVSVTIPRSIAPHQRIQELTLHAFGDASSKGVSSVVYPVVKQENGVAQNILSAKSRVAKRGLTIPRLELVSGHMAANLITNFHEAIQPSSLQTCIVGWTAQ